MCQYCRHTSELHRPTLAPDTTIRNQRPLSLTPPGGVPLPPPPRHTATLLPQHRNIPSIPQSTAGPFPSFPLSIAGPVPSFSQLPIGSGNSLGMNLPSGIPSNLSAPLLQQFKTPYSQPLSTARENRKASMARMNPSKPGKQKPAATSRIKTSPQSPIDELSVLIFPLNVCYRKSPAIINLNPFVRSTPTPNPLPQKSDLTVQNLL
jgi:hypothetical protein